MPSSRITPALAVAGRECRHMPRPPGNRRPLKATVIAALPKLRISLPMEEIARFCRRWSIARLEVFGSVLGDDFGPDSDLDFVATYAPQAQWSLLDRVRMKLELEAMLGRPVDLLNRRALERANSHGRAASILAQTQSLYVES